MLTPDQRLSARGKELFYVKPLLLGGDANAPENIVFLDRRKHIEVVRYWNRIIRSIRRGGDEIPE